jgi:hypothetical protein
MASGRRSSTREKQGSPTAHSTRSARIPYFDRPGSGPDDAPAVAGSTSSLELLPAAPNPFSERTTIRFLLPAPGRVRLEVLDILGRRVMTLLDGPAGAGMHAIRLDGQRLGSMVHLYRLTSGTQEKEGQVTVIR